MSGYRFGITCRRCGGDVTHLTGGTVAAQPKSSYTKPYGMVSTAVVRCEACAKEYLIRAVLEDGPVLDESEKARVYRARRKTNA